jgi:putative transposase
VNPANTSRTCPNASCGHISAANRKTQADFACVRCGYTDNAERVGALNTLWAGLALRDACAA